MTLLCKSSRSFPVYLFNHDKTSLTTWNPNPRSHKCSKYAAYHNKELVARVDNALVCQRQLEFLKKRGLNISNNVSINFDTLAT